MPDLLGVRDAAKVLDRNASTISRYLKKHPVLNHAPAGTRPKIDPDEVRRHMKENVNGVMSGNHAGTLFGAAPPPGDAGHEAPSRKGKNEVTYAAARAMREALMAQHAKVDLDEKLGRLVDKSEVTTAAFDAARLLRDRVMAVATKIAGRLAGMTDEKEIAAALRRDLGDALNATADELELNRDAA